MIHYTAKIRANVPTRAKHIVGAPARRKGIVGIATAAAIFDDRVVAAWALHIAFARSAKRVAEALI